MELSKRALAFLEKSIRETRSMSESDIRKIFLQNDAPIFEPLIDFELNYGGYLFNAGLEPIKFSLLRGLGGYPKENETAFIEFEQSEKEFPQYFFECATTNYQMGFFLDETGIYYEDYKAKASSFSKCIEHLALWDEIKSNKEYEIIFSHRSIVIDTISQLQLDQIEEASDQYTGWFKNECMFMEQSAGLATLFVSNKYPEKEKLKLFEDTKG